jgi:hypothetical protein
VSTCTLYESVRLSHWQRKIQTIYSVWNVFNCVRCHCKKPDADAFSTQQPLPATLLSCHRGDTHKLVNTVLERTWVRWFCNKQTLLRFAVTSLISGKEFVLHTVDINYCHCYSNFRPNEWPLPSHSLLSFRRDITIWKNPFRTGGVPGSTSPFKDKISIPRSISYFYKIMWALGLSRLWLTMQNTCFLTVTPWFQN